MIGNAFAPSDHTTRKQNFALRFVALHPCPPSFRMAPSVSKITGFHSSSRGQNELPKSPFQAFVEVLRDDPRKNGELQDNVKQQGDVEKFQDSEAMKKSQAAYEKARVRHLSFMLRLTESQCSRKPKIACSRRGAKKGWY